MAREVPGGLYTWFKESNNIKYNLIIKNKIQIYNNLQRLIIDTDITKFSENNKKIFFKLEFNIKKGFNNFDIKEAVDLVEKYLVIKLDTQRNTIYFFKENFVNTVEESTYNDYFNKNIVHPGVAIGQIDDNIILIHFTTKQLNPLLLILINGVKLNKEIPKENIDLVKKMIIEKNPKATSQEIDKIIKNLLEDKSNNKITNKIFEEVNEIKNINKENIYIRPNKTWYLGEYGDQLLNNINDHNINIKKEQLYSCVYSLIPKNIYYDKFLKQTWPYITTDMVERIQYETMIQKDLIKGFNIYTGNFNYISQINVNWFNLREEYESSTNLKYLLINWDWYYLNKEYRNLVDKNLIKKQTILETIEFHTELTKINTEIE